MHKLLRAALPALCAAGAAAVIAAPAASAATTSPKPGLFTSIDSASLYSYNGTGDPTGTDVGSAWDAAVSPDGRTAYVLVNALAGTAVVPVTVATGAAGSAIATLPPSDPFVPTHIALSPDGSTAYVGDNGRIYRVTLGTGEVDGSFAVGGRLNSMAVSQDGANVYASVGNELLKIDAGTGAVSDRLGLGQLAGAIKLAANGTTGYVIGDTLTDRGAKLFKVNLRSMSIVDRTAVPGGNPFEASSMLGLALSPDQTLLYITGVDTLSRGMGARFFFAVPVRAVDLRVGNEIFISNGEPFPRANDAAFTPDGRTLYMFTMGRGVKNFLVAIDVNTNRPTISTDFFLLGQPIPGTTSVVVPADQPPAAAFRATARCAGTATTFDASASTVAAGTIVRYAWTFGDGSTELSTGPRVSHTYAKAGLYAVSVTETDTAGTSTSVVFDGQTVLLNGGPSARIRHTVTVGSSPPPAQGPPPPAQGPSASGGSPVTADDTLALTGSNTAEALATAGLLIGLGAGLARAGRRRSSRGA